MTEEDLLSQIKQKALQRRGVFPRDTSLLGTGSVPAPSLEMVQGEKLHLEPDELPQISKRLAVRLEDDLRKQLETLCKDERITPETFLEAALVICQANPGTMGLVMAEAKDRYAKRKVAGELRRLKTINQKYQRGG